ncbi:MAG: alpha/beta hydrolase fold domain-containing protein [Rhodobacterales bacterium]|nr:alpha/beta hydrolase fold domain-containing protein [Rhodobacterales bacterium]
MTASRAYKRLPVQSFTYAAPDGAPLLLDVHRPAIDGPAPTVVMVHGGGFSGGSRSMRAVHFCTETLIGAGFAVVAMDYRKGNPKPLSGLSAFNQSLNDTLAAFDWIAERADDLALDRANTHLMGLSAGAAIAVVASSRRSVRSLVGLYGPYDFTQLPLDQKFAARCLLRSNDPEVWDQASPWREGLTHAPMLLFHGESDRLVSITHSERLQMARHQAGRSVQLIRYPGVGHGFLNFPDKAVSKHAHRAFVTFLSDPPSASHDKG